MKEVIIGIVCALIGVAGGYCIALWQTNITKRNTKIELYTEAKTITDKLYELYIQKLDADVGIEFYRTMLQSSPTTRFNTYEDKHTDFKLEKSQLEVQENSEALEAERLISGELESEILKLKEKFNIISEKIRFNFEISTDANQSIIAIAKIKQSPVYFGKVDRREVTNHTQLLEWVDNAKGQGKKILDSRYNKPRLEMLKSLENQIKK